MSKRHLSQQQSQRIRRLQDRRIREARDSQDIDESHLGPAEEGLVISHFGTQVEVESLTGHPHRCHFRSNMETLVTGDRVIWQPDAATGAGVVTALLPRRSLLSRPDAYQKVKPVAANIDLILIVFAPLPVPSAGLIDRYLVACEASRIPALLVLNKSDLIDAENRPRLEQWLEEYARLGYEHLIVCCQGDLHDLRARIRGRTVALVGQSGVGKSSLVNALLPDAGQKVNDISANSLLGQHTTTNSRLFHLDHDGGALIDSPGIREFGLWHLDEERIRDGFVECRELYGTCRFRNCRHDSEPGCALKAAIAEGRLLPRRYESLQRLLAECKSQ